MKNLISIILFLVMSMLSYALLNTNLFNMFPESAKIILGCPPPVFLINVALAIYCFSAVVIKICAIAKEKEYIADFDDIGYISAFFVFYMLTGTLTINFMPVFVIGILVYSLDLIHFLLYHHNFQSPLHSH